jgi:hypothetical protein
MTDDDFYPALALEEPENLPTPICWAACRPDEALSELQPLAGWVEWLTGRYQRHGERRLHPALGHQARLLRHRGPSASRTATMGAHAPGGCADEACA